jgi:uncharacterized protein (DUF1697 family)
MIRNAYQEILAERSMVIEPAGPGEYWRFRWYIDPISNGLAKWIQLTAHVSEEENVRMIGTPVALDMEESAAQEQAFQFIKERYERYGLTEEDEEEDEEDTESRI